MKEILQNLYLCLKKNGIEDYTLNLLRRLLKLMGPKSHLLADPLTILLNYLLGLFLQAEGYKYDSYYLVFDSLAAFIVGLKGNQQALKVLNEKLSKSLFALCQKKDS